MNFVKSSLLTGISAIIRVLSNLIITKIVAITMGASGMVLLGQVTNLIGFVRALSTGGVQQGTVKLVAEISDNQAEFKDPINASIQISLLCSTVLVLLLILFRKTIGLYFFSTTDYNYLFFVISGAVFFYSLNVIYLSVLNGLRHLRLYIIANIVGNIIGLLVSLILISFFESHGLLIAFSINQSIAVVSTLYLIRNQNWYSVILALKSKINKKYIKKLLAYSSMNIVSAITVPLAYVLIRKIIIKERSVDEAGYWEALIRISSVFVMIIATAYSTYLLPAFSILKEKKLRLELLNIYKIVIPLAIVSSSLIFLFKDYIITILFSRDFESVAGFFRFQLIGDTFKIITYVTGFLLIAKGKVKYYIINEIIQFSVYVGFSLLLISKKGIEGATMAYMVTAIICCVYQLLVFRKILWLKD
ncbi:polysaccharide transporter, PST family [Tenacibaculum sp. MAR_2009_124]|uniref:O-antigen translocase n=1 Tax=Tenacibaculum sp. MAR_2009_124 TaxID=1250059 RepID=UPI0008964B7B|nr:O-antigen translocase [Tenacibaculum sp. MAR_2009_124]SEB69608.1 polysaccharide transporter, PST family [Tenacibaculum sp. MAR_2009_124]